MLESTLAKKKREVKLVSDLRRQVWFLIVKHLRESTGLTFQEIGEEFGKTRSWAHQEYQKALKYFRNERMP